MVKKKLIKKIVNKKSHSRKHLRKTKMVTKKEIFHLLKFLCWKFCSKDVQALDKCN